MNQRYRLVMSTTTQVSSESESRGQYQAKAYSAASASSPLIPITIPRRDPGDDDVQIKILFCGINASVCRAKSYKPGLKLDNTNSGFEAR
jgi:hypothetical protein